MSEGQSWETVYTTEFNNKVSQQFKISEIEGYLTSDEFQTSAMWHLRAWEMCFIKFLRIILHFKRMMR